MLVTTGVWLFATGLVALSLESVGAAVVFFVIAAVLIRFA
jgi:ABC-type thiamin/hydroxymethylpyrimidine transport system permease subunit